jgi:protein-glutamine gamma-glutamyltransferase
MDPTPTINTTVATNRWESIRRLGESVRLQWDRLFVRYSAKDQLAAVHGIREGSDALRERVSRWSSLLSTPVSQALSRLTHVARTFQPGMLGLATGAIVIGLALLLLMLAIVQLYARMVRTVERHGVSKPPSATASEFARLVEREWKAAGPMVADVIALYHQGRFSRTPLTPDELSRAAEQVGRLQSLKHMAQ